MIMLPHGRILSIGQVWESNDERRLRAVRIMGFEFHAEDPTMTAVRVKNVVTGKISFILAKNFTIGTRGWSLLKEAA